MRSKDTSHCPHILRGAYIYSSLLLLAALLTFSSCQERRARDDQGRTSACWIYAMVECIEHEAALRGDSVHLSRQWLMAKELEEQTVWAYFTMARDRRSATGDRQPSVSIRGVGPEAIRLIDRYGLVPYVQEKTEITNSHVLERKLTLLARQARSLDELHERMDGMLPQFTLSRRQQLGDSSPSRHASGGEAFYYLSMRYNPHQFAESIMYCQHWHFYASVPCHPYGRPFPLEVADNHRHHEYLNLPIDTLTDKVLASLRDGHAVYWEYGSRSSEGHVSSDHAMAIVGIRQPKKGGKPYLLCKNSYGKKWGNKGYCLVSIDDFKAKTCNVGILEQHEKNS